jgi:hypothetical protein
MDAEFRAELNAVVHGRYQVTGESRIAVDGLSAKRRQGVSLHEHTHAELSDNSTYGFFQRWLLFVRDVGDRELRARARQVLDVSFLATQRTQEGLAALRELAWVAANEGHAKAASYLEGLPDLYREGLEDACRLVGDPRAEPYDGTDAQGYHVTLVALGLLILNSPVLDAYRVPDALFDDSLPWLAKKGPDERFVALLENERAVYRTLRRWRLIAELWRPEHGVEALVQLWDEIAEEIAAQIPGWQVVTAFDAQQQVDALKAAWLPRLGVALPGPREGSSAMRDVSAARALDREHERMNAGPHEANELAEVEVPLDDFLAAHRRPDPAQIVRLVMLSTLPPSIPAEVLPHCDVGLLSIPLWIGHVGAASPLVRFLPAITCVAPMADVLASSEEVAAAGAIWYTHVVLARAIRRRQLQLAGLLIEKCGSARELLWVAQETEAGAPESMRYARVTFEDRPIAYEYVLAVFSDSTFSFTLADHVTADVFEDAAREQGLQRRDAGVMRTGATNVRLPALARIARWGLVGS